jgi:hypothetical protein
MEEYSENQSLFDKKADDLTVADNIKIFSGLVAIQELEQAELEESEEV